jgi:hypothetical protein
MEVILKFNIEILRIITSVDSILKRRKFIF